MVETIVHRVMRELMLPSAERDDLMAYAFKGLVEARGRFDPSRGVLFSTFATYRVRGAIIDGVRQMTRLNRRTHALIKAAEAADRITEGVAYARAEPGAKPSIEATVGALDGALTRLTTNFIVAQVARDHESRAEVDPEESLLRAEAAEGVREALEVLDERERALVHGYYFENVPFEQTAKRLGISKSWASRIYTRALDKLRAEITERQSRGAESGPSGETAAASAR